MTKQEEKKKSPIEEAGFKEEEVLEVRKGVHVKSGYPKPKKHFRVWIQSPAEEHSHYNLEEAYYWMIGSLTTDFSMDNLHKITDSMAASASSSLFGDNQSRLGAQQGQISQLLRSVGQMVQDLFKLVRELRQLSERLEHYKSPDDKNKKVIDIAEKTLKDVWITQVEGGTQNPASVYGMAKNVGYAILPDLFFNAPCMATDDIEAYVKKLEFNENVKTTLVRKLYQFSVWKKRTHQELNSRRKYQVSYLRQHFDAIRMYLEWIKPYIKQAKMLQLNHDNPQNGHNLSASKASMDSAYLISSFQGALAEIETLAYRSAPESSKDDNKVHSVVLASFFYRTQPAMNFHAKDSWQQKGPIHVGRVEVTLRAYAWTFKEIEAYKKLRMGDDLDMLFNIDASLKEAMEMLGDDLVNYLQEGGLVLPEEWVTPWKKKEKEDEHKEKAKQATVTDPFLGAVKGLGELFSPLIPSQKGLYIPLLHKKKPPQAGPSKKDVEAAEGFAAMAAWQVYKNFKKAHGMVSW